MKALWCILTAAAVAATALADAPATPLDQAAELLATAARQLGEGKAEEALESVKAALARPGASDDASIQVQAWFLEGQAEAMLEHWEPAVAALTQLLDKYADAPMAPDALNLSAAIRRRQGRPTEARRLFEQTIADYPSSWARNEAERALFRLDLAEAKLPQATERLGAYLTAQPWAEDGPWLLGELAQAQLGAAQQAAAVAAFERLRQDYPGTQAAFEARRGLVDCYQSLERWDDALAVLDEAAATNPEMFAVAEIEMLRADLLEQKGDLPAAAAALASLSERYPGTFVSAQASLRRVQVLLAADDKDSATKAGEALLAQFDSPFWRVQALRVLMHLYHDQENYDRAEDSAAALVELTSGTPQGAEALYQLAQSQKAAGRERAARATLEKLMQEYKGPPYAVYAEAMLDEWNAALRANP